MLWGRGWNHYQELQNGSKKDLSLKDDVLWELWNLLRSPASRPEAGDCWLISILTSPYTYTCTATGFLSGDDQLWSFKCGGLTQIIAYANMPATCDILRGITQGYSIRDPEGGGAECKKRRKINSRPLATVNISRVKSHCSLYLIQYTGGKCHHTPKDQFVNTV